MGAARTATVYTSLDPARIVDTAAALSRRIGERFPGSGLSRVAVDILAVCRQAAALSDRLARPNWWLRAAISLAILLLLALIGGMVVSLDLRLRVHTMTELFQVVDNAVNDVVFLGLAVLFLLNWEVRLKRRLAHIIDMHQLTKDPERLLGKPGALPATPSSPERRMTPLELTRYLDYCSESLAVLSKVAALYVQRFDDPVTLAAVNEVENLTSGLSRKIWQKIMILDRMLSEQPPLAPPATPPPAAAPAGAGNRVPAGS
jgi:hypothetical protein